MRLLKSWSVLYRNEIVWNLSSIRWIFSVLYSAESRIRCISIKLLTCKEICVVLDRGGVEDTRLEAKAKDTKKFRGQGQGQTLSRPRPRTKDTGACVLQKFFFKFSKIFFKQSRKKGLQNFFSGEKGLQKIFFRRFPLEENKKRSSQIFCKVSGAF